MAKRSAESLLTPTPAAPTFGLRLPEGTPPELVGAVHRLVAACPPGTAQQSDAGLWLRYAEVDLQATEAATHMRAEGAVIDGKPSPWLKVYERNVRMQRMLSVRLRLGPQARIDAGSASRRQQGHRPSLYDSMPAPTTTTTEGSRRWPK